MKNNKKGFTLAELLIVIAIMAILIAIAIPVFSAQLERARMAVDKSVARSAMSMAEADYLLNHADDTSVTTALYYKFKKDDNNLTIDGAPVADTKTSSGIEAESKTYKAVGELEVSVLKDGKVQCNWDFDAVAVE